MNQTPVYASNRTVGGDLKRGFPSTARPTDMLKSSKPPERIMRSQRLWICTRPHVSSVPVNDGYRPRIGEAVHFAEQMGNNPAAALYGYHARRSLFKLERSDSEMV